MEVCMNVRIMKMQRTVFHEAASLFFPAASGAGSAHKEREMKGKSKDAVLIPPGDLLGNMEALLLKKNIEQLLSTGVRQIVLDLGGVRLANGPGLMFLIDTQKSLESMNGSLVLRNLRRTFRNQLKKLNMESSLHIQSAP